MNIIPFNTGHCIGSGKAACRTKSRKAVKFLARAFLLQTATHGNILFDAGYDMPYLTETPKMYHSLIPAHFKPEQSVIAGLKQHGLSPSDLSYIFISHYHVDHIAGLKSLGNIPWIYREKPLQKLMNYGHLRAYKNGFFKGLLPEIPEGSIPIQESDFTSHFFDTNLKSATILNGLNVVDLPGHALGQMGLFVENTFMIADAAWSQESIEENALPSFLGLLVQHDRKAYINTFQQIQNLPRKIECIPTHVMEEI